MEIQYLDRLDEMKDDMFQLGHVFSDMEINFRKNQGGINNAFQLGHVFSDMEIDTNNRGVW